MNFILPTTIVRVIDFVSIENNEVSFEGEEKKYLLCKTLENEIIIIKFLTNLKKLEITEEEVKNFLDKKANKQVKKQQILKLKEHLSKDEDYKEEIMPLLMEEIQEKEPELTGNKLMMKVFSKIEEKLETIAEELILKDKTIKKGSVIRLPLSNNKKEEATFASKTFPIYESYSLLMTKDKNPMESGLYLYGNSMHSIPLIFEKNKKGKYSVRFNGEFANKEILLALIEHSIRTSKKTQSYFLTFYLPKGSGEEIEELVKKINLCGKSSSEKEKYLDYLLEIKNWIEENENEKILIFRNSYIYLPILLEEEDLYLGTLLEDLGKAFFNVSLRGLETENKEETIKEINSIIKEESKNNKIYGFYNILYKKPDEHSDTYGFLLNNISKHQIMLSFEDTLNIYRTLLEKYKDKIKPKEGSSSDNKSNKPKLLEL